ncbi:MAG: LptA/OstA family protein [Archangium sp.]|nr:LptA/OstA family protein [Archangium sp.]
MTSLLLGLLLAAPDAGVLLSRPVAISADKLEVFKKESRALYSGHAKAQRDTMTMTCDFLEVFFTPASDVQRIVAKGNVHAVDGDREAWGDQAEFINETGVLTLHGNPRGKQGPREVEGEVVTFVTGIDKLTVTKAHSRVKEPKDQRVSIDADLLTLEGTRNEAKWTGHVRAVKAKTILVAPEVTAHYDDQGEIDRVLARGGVEVTEGDRWARGQNADYDVPKGRLVVTGKPQAKQGKTRMNGTRVTFFTGTEFLEVENATTVIEVDKKKVK